MYVAYLAGPMSNVENDNHDEFMRIAQKLRKTFSHWKILNPEEWEDRKELDWQQNLGLDVKIIIDEKPDAIILIPGWRDSVGVRIECFNTIYINKSQVFEYFDMGDKFRLEEIVIDFTFTTRKPKI